jgi:hypothetical protein
METPSTDGHEFDRGRLPSNGHKKQRIDDGSAGDAATLTTTEATESITTIDLDLIKQRQLEIQAALHHEMEEMRTATAAMQRTLQEQFTTAMYALEVQIEKNTQTMIESLGNTLNRAVEMMNAQAENGREFLKAFQAQADRMQKQADRLIHGNTSPTGTPVRKKQSTLRQPMTDEDDMDEEATADRSHNPPASQAGHPKEGTSASTGDIE